MVKFSLYFAFVSMFVGRCVFASDVELISGMARLQLVENSLDRNFSLRFLYSGHVLETLVARRPISVVVNGQRRDGCYSDVSLANGVITCRGVVASKHGTRFVFTDQFVSDGSGSFALHRDVQVQNASEQDQSFNTLFGLRVSPSRTLDDVEIFVPAIWYRTNFLGKMAGELAAHPDDRDYFFREDRLPLPMVAGRELSSGNTVSLVHTGADPITFAGEGAAQQVVDPRIQFGSVGVQKGDGTSVAFLFPGSEGERNHVIAGDRNRWAHRCHPVKLGVQHRYQLLISIFSAADYPGVVQSSWKRALEAYRPELRPVNVVQAYDGLIETLEHYWVGTGAPNHYDAPGFPFSVLLPSGDVRLYNYQMGFIGRQLPNAYFLIGEGFAEERPGLRDKGEQIIDFWAAHSLTESGLPRTWYDPGVSGQKGSWRETDNVHRGGTALRVATTGMEGMLAAWQLMASNGVEKPQWLDACRRFGDWLVNNQNQDGSYFVAYKHQSDGSRNEPTNSSRFGAINPIRFLVMLFGVTGDARYRQASIDSGEFCYEAIHLDYSYVGSVIDNPTVIDRETGQEAIGAFLALYDLTGQAKWLSAAEQAARYTETWMYAYEVPAAIGDEGCDFPADRSIVGQTVIATGHSAADLGFAFSAFDYYRLYLFTGDVHFLDVARLLIHNTKQSLNWDGSLYPGKPRGLQLEAFTVTVPRRRGVMECLSWNYAAHLDPLIRFREAFGTMDLDEIEQRPLRQRRRSNRLVGVNLVDRGDRSRTAQ